MKHVLKKAGFSRLREIVGPAGPTGFYAMRQRGGTWSIGRFDDAPVPAHDRFPTKEAALVWFDKRMEGA